MYIEHMSVNKKQATVSGVLSLKGAGCPSCAYTIEKLGRRISGVSEVRVDVNTQEIRVEYDGNPAALEGVAAVVARLGYQASVKNTRGD